MLHQLFGNPGGGIRRAGTRPPSSVLVSAAVLALFVIIAKRYLGVRGVVGCLLVLFGAHALRQDLKRRGAFTSTQDGNDLNGLLNANSIVFVRRDDGRVSRISRAHLALMLREGDFNENDYEELLRLDDEMPTAEANRTGLSVGLIASIPTTTITSTKQLIDSSCCIICLNDFVVGDVKKVLHCGHDAFHAHCCDGWLKVKGRCPICVMSLVDR